MHEHHDEELILDLRNDPDATDAAIAAHLDGCEQCLADLAEQRAIAEVLADLEPVSLTGTERAELRTAVLAEVAPAPVIPLVPKRAWDWTRLGTVAAALVGVVAVAGLFSTIGGNDEATNISNEDSVAAADEAESDLGALALEAAPSAGADGDDSAEDQPESDFGGSSVAEPSSLVLDLGRVDRTALQAELDRIRDEVLSMTESSGILQRYADEVDASCFTELADPGAIRAIVTATVDGLDVEVYFDNIGGEFGFAGTDCSSYDIP